MHKQQAFTLQIVTELSTCGKLFFFQHAVTLTIRNICKWKCRTKSCCHKKETELPTRHRGRSEEEEKNK